MRVLLQRVTSGMVQVNGNVVGQIGLGVVLLVGIGQDDTPPAISKMAGKIASLRIFSDQDMRFQHNLLDISGGALVISQFTLYADCSRGRRPNFTEAAQPTLAESLIDQFSERLVQLGVNPVATGQFGAHMNVEIQNHGPVTIWLDSDDWISR